jgi:hypothetical protein
LDAKDALDLAWAPAGGTIAGTGQSTSVLLNIDRPMRFLRLRLY